MNKAKLSVRVNRKNPNHHLWNNNGTWWFHYTVHHPDFTSERHRFSLKTQDVKQARRLRDIKLAQFAGCFRKEVSL